MTKNFRDEIKIDFGNVAGYQFSSDCISDGVIAKILIYDRNATGKTNLGRAIMDIGSTMFGGHQELRDEELIINGTSIFRCDFGNREYHFDNLKDVDAETANVERYLQALEGGEDTEESIESRLPFLRWLISNVALKNDSVLIRLTNYVRRMVMITVGNEMPYRVRKISAFL